MNILREKKQLTLQLFINSLKKLHCLEFWVFSQKQLHYLHDVYTIKRKLQCFSFITKSSVRQLYVRVCLRPGSDHFLSR